MEHLTTVRELFKETDRFLDTKVSVGGWVRSIRDSKTFGFLVLSDGSFYTTLQVVFHDKMENFAEICNYFVCNHWCRNHYASYKSGITAVEVCRVHWF